MGKSQPYRLSGRVTASRAGVPKIVAIGLAVASCSFGFGAFVWLLMHAVAIVSPSHEDGVQSIYAWTVDGAMLVTAVLCAWRPVPGTRSNLFARVAIVGWLVAIVAEHWPRATHYGACGHVLERFGDPPWILVAASSGPLVLVLALAGLVLSAGRRFALPRWIPVVAAGLGATVTEVGLGEVLRVRGIESGVVLLPTYIGGVVELLMLLAFTAAFGLVAFAVRRRPFLDEDAVLSTTRAQASSGAFDPRAFDHWRVSITAVLASLFIIATRVGEELGLVRLFVGLVSSRPIACTLGLVAFLVLVERARRRHAEVSSFALTVFAGLAALCGAVFVFSVAHTGSLAFREIAMMTMAVALGGIALLLPNLPVVARHVTKVKSALSTGALFLILSAVAELSRAGSCGSAGGTAEPGLRAETLLLFAGFFFVTLAVHLARPIEREALIEEALAARDAARVDDATP